MENTICLFLESVDGKKSSLMAFVLPPFLAIKTKNVSFSFLA